MLPGGWQKTKDLPKHLMFLVLATWPAASAQDKSILVPEEFNAAKTWTEYVNRLIGAVSGLFLLLTCYIFVQLLERKQIDSLFKYS